MVKFQYRHEDSGAAMAANWWRVLLVDALVGVVVLALGVLSLARWNAIVGWILVLLGILYLFAIIGRFRTWKAHRAESGR
jgi:protein-S-isoprenylcysteine O-methyltransferase Ste14